jgi:hypothetical protein
MSESTTRPLAWFSRRFISRRNLVRHVLIATVNPTYETMVATTIPLCADPNWYPNRAVTNPTSRMVGTT